MSPGQRLWDALHQERPLQIVGAVNAYVAMLAQQVGFRALYLSGAGVANSSYGLPDLGLTSLDNVLEDVRRITAASTLPLLVDADTGWGNALAISRTVKELSRAGAAAMHIEDQVAAKRCGHREGKQLVSTAEMVERIQAAVESRTEHTFAIMARTDAVAVEGMEAALERAVAYREAGANFLFPEALTSLEQYAQFKKHVGLPILANITEFGNTPLFTTEQLASAGVDMVLYPLSVSRAMNRAAVKVLEAVRMHGTQAPVMELMQTRDELYRTLNYESLESKVKKVEKHT